VAVVEVWWWSAVVVPVVRGDGGGATASLSDSLMRAVAAVTRSRLGC
jgi:hypothetical protein